MKESSKGKEITEGTKLWYTILDSISVSIFLIDLDNKILQCNKATLDILGKSKYKDVIGHSCWELVHSTSEQVDWCPVKRMHESGHREVTIQKLRGKWVEISADPVLDDQGKINGAVHVIRDISEKKIVEEKYKNIIDNLMDMVIILDLKGNFQYISPQIYDISGFKPEELIGKSGFKFMHPDDIKNAAETLREAIVKKKSVYIEYRTIHKNGYYLDLSASGKIVNIEGEDRIFTVVRDISVQKRSELKLRESEEKYRLISENTDDLIAVYNEDGNVEYLNAETHSRILGYNVENFTDKSFRDMMVYEDDREIAGNSVKEGLKKGSYYYQFRLKHQQGNYLWFEVTGKTFTDDNGEDKLLCVSRNINEMKLAEQKIKESEENFRTIADQAFMGILIIQNDKVEYVNKALLQIFEYLIEEMDNWVKDDLLKIIHPDDLQYLRNYRKKLRADDPNIKPYYSYRVFTKSNKLKWIDQFSRPIIYMGKPAELVTIMDITEKKEAEKELIKLNSLKSEFLRRTSHELKTPLVSIKGFSDLLLNVHKEKLDDYVLATIHEIKLGCERLKNLIQDILKTSELESGATKLKKTEGDLSFLIKLSIRESQGLTKLRNHSINLNIHDKLTTNFEQEQIHQVISNLINNAIKYTPPEGTIEIKSEINNHDIKISIKDNGIGITSIEKEDLFTQFGKIERYGQGLDIISEGTGLGLYISKKIIELHDGAIWVESEGRNKGSTFYFTLPIIKGDLT